jgi:hypothetical protein
MRAHWIVGVFLAGILGCHDARQGPCEEPIEPSRLESTVEAREPNATKLVHLVTFEMGPFVETMEGYMLVRGNAVRLYGMTESGQRAFDVAWISSNGHERVARIYRAPFLEDDRILDQIAHASARIFLLRPNPDHMYEVGPEYVRVENGTRFFFGGIGSHLRWLEGPGFSACFMDWQLVGKEPVLFYEPTRIHYHSDEGPYPYDLRMKLVRAEALEKPPPDSLFEAPEKK